MNSEYIVDSHSHIGCDHAWDIEGKLDEYILKAKELGIKESLLMPTPMPIIETSKYRIIPIMLGNYEEEYFIVKGVEDTKELRGLPVSKNPYRCVNELLYRKTKDYQDIRIHFVPLIHPLLDTYEYLEKIIERYNPKALKFHGYSSIVSPLEIEDKFWQFIKKCNIPLIVHTDCDTTGKKNIDSIYRNENSPINWINILDKYDIKAYLTHGARLCEKSIKLVNKSPNFVIGLGPDLLLSNCQDRMYSKKPYLEELFSKVDIDKICFDLDYPWNVDNYENQRLEWNSIDRIKKLNLTEEERQKVLSKNSQTFFKL